MFRRANIDTSPAISFYFEGQRLTGKAGDTVASALLANNRVAFRQSYVSNTPRAPFCMIGNCFDCLVQIDGINGIQACLTPLKEGMSIRRDAVETAPASIQ